MQSPSALNRDGAQSSFVYMDSSSTTRPDPRVAEAVARVLTEEFGNPSSLHRLGVRAEEIIREARRSAAALIGAGEDEVFFTSGGTEANNWAIMGTALSRGPGCHIVSTAVEHPSVIAPLERLKENGYRVTLVGVDGDGRVDPAEVIAAVKPDTALVSVMLVQNEIGTVEPVKEIGKALSGLGGKRPRFHVDAVQGFARLRIDIKEWGVDLLTVSAHKIHGPKGAGALYVRRGLRIAPLIYGGGQELGMRSGTENVPGIAGFGEACRLWANDMDDVMARLYPLREMLIAGVRDASPGAVLHGPEDEGVAPYIVHFSFPGFRGESILHALEERGVYVSTGSACSSHKAKPSPVVLALGAGEREALGSIRFSMSRYTTGDDVRLAVAALRESLEELAPWKDRPAPAR